MRAGDNVFVYGTLKRGHGANGFLQNGNAEFVSETRISGTMYSLGGFPGLKTLAPPHDAEGSFPFISEGPTVVGELYRITDDRLPARLDRYEGYPHLYDRVTVECENGERAWTYVYNGDTHEERLVPTGEWS